MNHQYVISTPGKGYYVKGKKDCRLRILLISNNWGHFKGILNESFYSTLCRNCEVDLHIHHYKHSLLDEIAESSIGKFHYYVIASKASSKNEKYEILNAIRKIPAGKLLLIDKDLPCLGDQHMSVYQDLQDNVYNSMKLYENVLDKYHKIEVSFQKGGNQVSEIVNGVWRFCLEQEKGFQTNSDVGAAELIAGAAYIITNEGDLASIVKKLKNSPLQLGKDIGIISFVESYLNELFDLSVITQDFKEMSRIAANLFLNKESKQVKSSLKIVRRNSI